MDPIGRFQVEREVGRGACGVVLKAHDPQLQRDVAIKLLAPERLGDAHSRARFQREATSVSRLKHSHLAAVYELGEQDGQPFLVMEWVEGETLQAVLKERERIPWEEALGILEGLAAGLDYAHSHDVVHRDVKAANIMLGPSGHPTVVDFGLASVTHAPNLTETGAVVGTPLYMAPEQLQGEPALPASDLYSLAVVFHEMVTGENPFNAPTMAAVFHKKLHKTPPPLGRPEAEAVMQRALARDPKERFPSGKALVEALRHPPRKRRSVAPLAALGLVALLLVGWSRLPSAPKSASPTTLQWTLPCPSLEGLTTGPGCVAWASEAGKLAVWASDTGASRWESPLGEAPVAAPLVHGNHVYVATESRLRAYDLASGKVAWTVDEDEPTALVLEDETLYATVKNGVVEYDARGEEQARQDLPGVATLVAGDGVVYAAGPQLGVVALDDSELKVLWKEKIAAPLHLATCRDGVLVATAKTLQSPRRWKLPLPAPPVGLAASPDLIVVNCQDGQTLAVGPDGKLRWQVHPEPELEVAPLITSRAVYVAGPRGLHGLDLQRGQELTTETPGSAWLPPVALGEQIFLATSSSLHSLTP